MLFLSSDLQLSITCGYPHPFIRAAPWRHVRCKQWRSKLHQCQHQTVCRLTSDEPRGAPALRCGSALDLIRRLLTLQVAAWSFVLGSGTEEFRDLTLEALLALLGRDDLNVGFEQDVWLAVTAWIVWDSAERSKHLVQLMGANHTRAVSGDQSNFSAQC